MNAGKRSGPVLIDAEGLGPAPSTVETAPPVPEALPRPDAAMQSAARLAARRPGVFSRLVMWSLGALISLAVGIWGWDLVTGLLARNAILGQIALALVAIVALGVVVTVLREVLAILRLGRIEAVQIRAKDPEARRERAAALAVSRDVERLMAAKEVLRLPIETLAARRAEILDADAMMDLTETTLLTPLDEEARRQIEAAARQVAVVTAFVPIALADVVMALVANLRMIRRIAEVYGGRGGTLGAWRLLRAVAQHLVATGAVAVGDDLISSVAGGGALSKISRRFGEGVVNAALTARVGIAAMEVCRPMPFHAAPRPRVTRVIQRALTGVFGGS